MDMLNPGAGKAWLTNEITINQALFDRNKLEAGGCTWNVTIEPNTIKNSENEVVGRTDDAHMIADTFIYEYTKNIAALTNHAHTIYVSYSCLICIIKHTWMFSVIASNFHGFLFVIYK